MIDAERVALGKCTRDGFVQRLGGREVRAKRLLDNHARPRTDARLVQPAFGEHPQDEIVFRRRYGEVEKAVTHRASRGINRVELFAQRAVALGIREVAGLVVNPLREAAPHVVLQPRARAFLRGVAQFRAPRLVGLFAAREADDVRRGRQVAIGGKIVERRDELAESEIAGRAEDHDIARLRHGPRLKPLAERVGWIWFVAHWKNCLRATMRTRTARFNRKHVPRPRRKAGAPGLRKCLPRISRMARMAFGGKCSHLRAAVILNDLRADTSSLSEATPPRSTPRLARGRCGRASWRSARTLGAW